MLPALAQDLRQGWLYHILHHENRHNTGPVPKDFLKAPWFFLAEACYHSQPLGVNPTSPMDLCTSSLSEQSLLLAVPLHSKLVGHALSSGAGKEEYISVFPYFVPLGCLPHSVDGPTVFTMGCLIWKQHTCSSPANPLDLQCRLWEAYGHGAPSLWRGDKPGRRGASRAALTVGCTSETGKWQICKALSSSETLTWESWDSFDCTSKELRTKQTWTPSLL